MDLHFKSAAEIAGLIRDRKVSAIETLEHFLARVEKYNPRLNAIIWLDATRARSRARAADAALAKGEIWGPLHGVPLTVKESYNDAGSPTTWGDPNLKNNVTETSALAVERLEKAGVVLFGKTNVPLLLADHQSFNAIYGTTNNPWDLSRTPGGSSGGSCGRPHRHRCRQRHRRLDPQSSPFLRRVRSQADLGRGCPEGAGAARLARLRGHFGGWPAGAWCRRSRNRA